VIDIPEPLAADRDDLRAAVAANVVVVAVDLMAPGADVWAAGLGGGYRSYTGTGIATGFVAGAAATVRSAYPTMPAADVVARLFATADPSYAGRVQGATPGPVYGYGLVDVYRALTESVGATAGPLPPAPPKPTPAPDRWSGGAGLAAALGGLGLVVAAVFAFLPMLARRGRERQWRPGAPDPPASARTPVHPTTRLFDDP
jgi:hypothetical protein